jgi:nitrous oxide reductase accessory protein NosL
MTISGCGRHDEDDLAPPQIRFGQDTCRACGMIIEDERYAAAVVTVDGNGVAEKHAFDDIGEMLEFKAPTGTAAERRYVREASTRKWLELTNATLVKMSDLQTPMGSGIAAYADAQSAQAAIAGHGSGTIVTREPSAATSREAK